MNLVRRIFARRRIRLARRALARKPSAKSYQALARIYADLGMHAQVVEVCQEGCTHFSDDQELPGLLERSRRHVREARLAELKVELAEAPRPAVWAESCELFLESGMVARAEELAREWDQKSPSADSHRMVARSLCLRYFSDRGRDLGRQALASIDGLLRSHPADIEGHNLRLQVYTRLGAWGSALKAAQELLQLLPGDPRLEARYRTLEAKCGESPSLERALLEVESTGLFADEIGDVPDTAPDVDVRPALRDLASRPDVQAAMYLRGSTMLVQGPRGATAERHARTVKSILTSSRTTGRRLGLGQVLHVRLEGDFGTLAITPGERDACAVWVGGSLPPSMYESLRALLQPTSINANAGSSPGGLNA